MKIFGHIDDVISKLAVDVRVLGREIGNMPGKLAVDVRALGQKIDGAIDKHWHGLDPEITAAACKQAADSIPKEKLWNKIQEDLLRRRTERDACGCPIDK